MQSISTKVVLIILILVLPLNILAIVLSHAAIEAMTEQAALSVTSVMENYNTELLHRMEDTGYLLWNMKTRIRTEPYWQVRKVMSSIWEPEYGFIISS